MRILLIGAGRIGSALAPLLAASVHTITIIDPDKIELSNCDSQGYAREDIGKPKAQILATQYGMTAIIARCQDGLPDADMIIDATDNFTARVFLNDLALERTIPLVHTAISDAAGVVFTVTRDGPCLRCVYPENPAGLACTQVNPDILRFVAARALSMVLTPEPVMIRVTEKDVRRISVPMMCKHRKQQELKEKQARIDATPTKNQPPFELIPCKTGLWRAKLQGKARLNTLKTTFPVVLDTPILVVINHPIAGEIVVHETELAFKYCKDQQIADQAAKDICACVFGNNR